MLVADQAGIQDITVLWQLLFKIKSHVLSKDPPGSIMEKCQQDILEVTGTEMMVVKRRFGNDTRADINENTIQILFPNERHPKISSSNIHFQYAKLDTTSNPNENDIDQDKVEMIDGYHTLIPVTVQSKMHIAFYLITKKGIYFEQILYDFFEIIGILLAPVINKLIKHQSGKIHLRKLKDLLENKRVFLDENLNCDVLANHLNISPGYLSRIIGLTQEENFTTMINRYRIRYFINKYNEAESRKPSILSLALESGFSSKATFNRAFKQEKGLSPSAYFKRVSIKKACKI